MVQQIKVKELIEAKLNEATPHLWQDSKNLKWFSLPTPQSKGSIGTEIYRAFLNNLDFESKTISNEGDIIYRKKNVSNEWITAEVKASKVNLEKTKCGLTKESLWFNQIRPNQSGWDEIVLVGIYPNHVRIWRKSRHDWNIESSNLKSVSQGHTGSEDLFRVMLSKNTKSNNFNEWSLIYSDQEGQVL